MVLCYFCNNKAENNCNDCNMPICKYHSAIIEKQLSSGETTTAPYCPNCAKK